MTVCVLRRTNFKQKKEISFRHIVKPLNLLMAGVEGFLTLSHFFLDAVSGARSHLPLYLCVISITAVDPCLTCAAVYVCVSQPLSILITPHFLCHPSQCLEMGRHLTTVIHHPPKTSLPFLLLFTLRSRYTILVECR